MSAFDKPFVRPLDRISPPVIRIHFSAAKRRVSLAEFRSTTSVVPGAEISLRSDKSSERGSVAPIIKSYIQYDDHPFIVIQPRLQKAIERGAASLAPHRARLIPRLLRRFECFLQITGRSARLESPNDYSFSSAAIEYIGALNSKFFMQGGRNVRGAATTAWLALLSQLRRSNPRMHIPEEVTRYHRSQAALNPLVNRFEAGSFLLAPLQMWCGWPTTNLKGKRYNVPLRNIADRLGLTFTSSIYEAAHLYYSNRRTNRVPCLRHLDRFIGSYAGDLTARLLKQPSFVRKFWQEFYEYYIDPSTSPDAGVASVTAEWRNALPTFVSEYLEPTGLFAKHPDVFPMPDPVSISGRSRKVRSSPDGWVKSNLLTLVPLHVTHSEAIEILFGQIEQDVATVTRWAEFWAQDLWDRYQRRLRLAPLGHVAPYAPRSSPYPNVNTPRRHLVHRQNPESLQNMCAAFAHYGYLTADDIPLHLAYPQPLETAARDLGIPTTLSLLPHCVLLTRHHPQITASFLEDLELYDEEGNFKCLQMAEAKSLPHLKGTEDSASQYIKGYKLRRGARLAEIEVQLIEKTYELVKQMIAVTEPLRTYLRKRGDSNWRYLLLSAGQSFGYPRRPGELADITSNPVRKARIVEQMRITSDLPIRKIRTLVDQLSIPTVRNSAGTLVYLETHSEAEMGHAMGHHPSSRHLLDAYLPEPLRRFFKDRFIRVFQRAILAEAMKGSRHFLNATGFTDQHQTREFLSNHALRYVTEDDQPSSKETNLGAIGFAFVVNDENMTALFKLRSLAETEKKPVCAQTRYWVKIADGLEANILSQRNRPDLQACLRRALCSAKPLETEVISLSDANA